MRARMRDQLAPLNSKELKVIYWAYRHLNYDLSETLRMRLCVLHSSQPTARKRATSESELTQGTEEEPQDDHPRTDRVGELPDFHNDRRSHNSVVSAPSAALAAAAAICSRGLPLDQTATSLYRRMSVRQNSAPEPAEGNKTSLTGNSGGSASPQSEPEFRVPRTTRHVRRHNVWDRHRG
ncbi:hypothetical protein PsorP6_003382 [Peronosclerospora sorghi]|uniref:Uncharacterized protein n=1 Tax=Peronosclerospora sorghi TaxID=230839 RepID=A0ACC0VLS1_9STRA|nr:hypothetical protein PsorP6_003382 [Peronosclerospora sorghi]